MANKLTVEFDAKDKLSAEIKRLESGVIRFVGAVSSIATAVGLIAFPIREAARFQAELLNTARTTGFANAQVDQLRGGLIKLSRQVGVSATDLATISTLGGQAGIGAGGDVQALLNFTQTVSEASVSLGSSVEETATSLSKLIQIFNIAPDEYKKVTSALTDVGNASTATAEQLFDVTRRIGDLGGSVSLPEAIALSAAMIDLGQTAETAGTTLSKVFANMKSKAADFAKFIDKQISTEDFANLVAKDGITALNLFLDRLSEIDQTTAAIKKNELIGGGRLFEATTKLQTQRLRANQLSQDAAKVQKEINALVAEGAKLEDENVAALSRRAEQLREAADQANIVNRLTNTANLAYDRGTAAADAQRRVQAGLNKTFDRFLQNLNAINIAVGQTALPTLTALFNDFSESLSKQENVDEFVKGFSDVVAVIKSIAEAISELRGESDNAFDFGALVRIGALVGAAFALKLLVSLTKALGRSLVSAVPGAAALASSLGAVSAASRTGAAGIESQASGILALQNRIRDVTNGVGEYQKAQASLAVIAQRDIRLKASQVNGAFTLAGAQQRLTEVNNKLAEVNLKLANSQSARQRSALLNVKKDFELRRTTLQESLGGLQAAQDNPLVKSIANAVPVIKAKYAEIVRSFNGVRAALSQPIASVGLAGATLQARILSQSLGQLTASILGVGNAYAATSGKVAAGSVLILGGFSRLIGALRLIGSIASKVFAAGFFGVIISELLDLFGLLDPVKKKLAEVVSFFGIKPPSFLETNDAEVRRLAKEQEAAAKVNDEFRQRAKFASQFNQEQRATLAVYRDQERLTEELTFNSKEPLKAQQSFAAAVEAGVKASEASLAEQKAITEELREQDKLNEQAKNANSVQKPEIDARLAQITKNIESRQKIIESAAGSFDILRQAITTAITPEQANALFGPVGENAEGLVDRLQKVQRRVEDLTKKRARLDEALQSREEIKLLQIGEETFTSLKEVTSAVEQIDESLSEAGKEGKEVTKAIESIAQPGIAQGIVNVAKLAKEPFNVLRDQIRSTRGELVNFKGLAVPKINATSVEELGRQLFVNRELVKVYTQQAEAATVAAQAAVSAAKQAADEGQRVIDRISASIARLRNERKLVQQEAERAKVDVKRTPQLNADLRALDNKEAEKQLEIRRRYELKYQAFGEATTLKEKQRLLSIQQDEKEETAKLAEEFQKRKDLRLRAEAEVQQNLLKKDTLFNFQAEQDNIAKLREEALRLNDIVDNDNVSVEQRTAAYVKQRKTIEEIRVATNSLQNQFEVVDTLNVAGKFALSDTEAEDLQKKVNDAILSVTSLEGSSASALAKLKMAQASAMQSVAQNAQVAAQQITQNLLQVPGESIDTLSIKIAQFLASTGQIEGVRNKLDSLRTKLLTDPSGVLDYAKATEALNTQLAKAGQQATISNLSIANFTEEQLLDAQRVAAQIKKFLSGEDNVNSIDTNVTAKLSEESLNGMRSSVQTALSDIEVNVSKVNLPETVTTLKTGGPVRGVSGANPGIITVGVRGATGGFFSGKQIIPRFAAGSDGPVRGPGGPKEDKVLALLSNGEYVIDAATTRLFGPGFFQMLQRVGRDGMSLNLDAVLGRLALPKFAMGGPVGFDFANDFKNSGPAASGESVNLNINIGGKRSRLFGDKESVGNLVKALKGLEKDV